MLNESLPLVIEYLGRYSCSEIYAFNLVTLYSRFDGLVLTLKFLSVLLAFSTKSFLLNSKEIHYESR